MSDEILIAFAAESAEILEGIEESVRALEAGSEGALAALFRQVHTLKGSAGIVGLVRLEAFSHSWEARLAKLRDGRSSCRGPEFAGALMACRDQAARILGEGGAAIGAEAAIAPQELGQLDLEILAMLDAAIAGAASPPASQARAPAPGSGIERRPGGSRFAQRAGQRGALPPGGAAAPRGGAGGESVSRIASAKLESILSLASELVAELSNIELSARSSGAREIVDALVAARSTAASIYRDVLATRMVPFGDVAGRFLRVVEEIARESGKKIRFVLSGAETEIDKVLADRMSEPLVHLIRNAADHGIERAEDRRAAGKAEEGVVALRARRESGLLSIRIEDDGRGIDVEAVRRRAIERGKLGAESRPSEEELLDLLFEPGFSLSSEVTKWSGRGVGLDVVKRSVIALRGTVRLESRQGSGSAAIVRLPLSLSLVEGFVARVGALALLVPFDAALSCVEFEDPGASSPFRNLEAGGKLVPSIDLGALYAEGQGRGRRVLVTMQDGKDLTGLVVDSVGETLSAAVRPLDRALADSPGVAGSAVLGDGSMILALDAAELCRLALRASSRP